ncbi:MAG: YCF48-related protein [Acidobacteriota bacterium]|nr:YCF48-related protein [Acidobacteriota bacterium]
MNPELCKTVRDALARQTSGEAHPSADVLASFVEQTLPLEERRLVTDHLARCADCREVVFLASSAAEEQVAEDQKQEQELMPRVPVRRISPALQAQAKLAATFRATPAAATPAAAPKETSGRKWSLRLVWAVPVAAALVLSFGLFVQKRSLPSAPQLASNATRSAPGQPPPEMQHEIAAQSSPPEALMKLPEEKQPKAAKAKGAPPTTAHSTLAYEDTLGVAKARPMAPPPKSAAPSEAADMQSNLYVLSQKAAAPPVSTRNTFAESATSDNAPAGALVATPQTSARGLSAAHTQWRITIDGQVEHFVAGAWIPALTNQTTIFHTVAVVGNDVWAGGEGGALFHSIDRGQHWTRMSLANASGAEAGMVTSIHFDDVQHGVVTTDSGTHWVTSDGGATWTKQ